MSLYEGQRQIRMDSELSEEFEVKVGMHQGSVLSPFLFAMVVDVVTEFARGTLSELLYDDDLVLISETIMGLTSKSVPASTRLEDPSKKGTKRTAKSAPINPCPSREGPYSTVFFGMPAPWTPSCGWRGFWPYRGMSRRIPDRQPRLGLATCVRQK